jgi:hypothetical protein
MLLESVILAEWGLELDTFISRLCWRNNKHSEIGDYSKAMFDISSSSSYYIKYLGQGGLFQFSIHAT